jgi:hypothetical protein
VSGTPLSLPMGRGGGGRVLGEMTFCSNVELPVAGGGSDVSLECSLNPYSNSLATNLRPPPTPPFSPPCPVSYLGSVCHLDLSGDCGRDGGGPPPLHHCRHHRCCPLLCCVLARYLGDG